MNVNDKVKLNLCDDEEIFEGLIDTWEAQTDYAPPKDVSALNDQIATVIAPIDEDGMIDIRLDNGVEFMCAPEELTLVQEITIKGFND